MKRLAAELLVLLKSGQKENVSVCAYAHVCTRVCVRVLLVCGSTSAVT